MIDDQDHLVDRTLRPDDFEHRMLIRHRGNLFPENGKRRTVSHPTPAYGAGFLGSVPGLVINEGGVFAFDVLLDAPIGSFQTDVSAITVGDSSRYFNVYFDPSEVVYVTVLNQTPSQGSTLEASFARLGLSTTRPVRLAAGIRLHDPNRFLCLWADGRLIAVTGKGSFPSQPTSWAANTQLEIENNSGIRIVSPQVAYYRGAPEPRGANR